MLLLVGCAGPAVAPAKTAGALPAAATAMVTSAPVATPAPPPAVATSIKPTARADASWERVVQRGEMVVGTAADYPPFEDFVNYKPVGFDIALMDELAKRMGVPVRYINFSFDTLGQVLQVGQVDAIIAALSVTPDRLAFADFSNVYYVVEEAEMASASSPLASIPDIDEAARYKIAVQENSVYDAWFSKNMVETGRMPAANLVSYMAVSDAVADLKAGRVDIVVVDAPAAQDYVRQGGVKIVGQGLTQQRLAIALPKGSVALRTKMNEALAKIQNDGTVARLAEQYLTTPAQPAQPVATGSPTQ
jgi:ABC-type amino acid transport substrate-binding protein